MGEDSTTPLSIMFAAFGLGAVLGPVLLNRFIDGTLRRMHWLILVGYAWMTLGWFLFSGASSLMLVSLALLVRAMGGSANWTYSSVILQKSVPDRYMGRVFSLDLAGFRLASAISIAVTGVLVDVLGTENIRQVVILFGLISVVPLVLWGLSIPWQNRQPEPLQAAD
jgi:MFS family permease